MLYPGSTITKVDVDANDAGGADKATVNLGFTAPAAPARAADWMTAEFAKKGIKVARDGDRSEEHTSELQSLMRISYAVFCLKKKKKQIRNIHTHRQLITSNTQSH